MARRTLPGSLPVSGNQKMSTAASVQQGAASVPGSLASSAAVYRPNRKANPNTDRHSIAKPWQVEAYRHVNICGEARYAASLFANIAARAEIGVSEPNALGRKAVWVNDGVEVDAFNELAATVRDRSKLIRDYMLHRVIAGEALDVDTPVATPTGFKRMGDLAAGDVILGGDGKPVRVLVAHPIRENRPCFEVELTGGVTVVADAEHLWQTRDRYGREAGGVEKVVTTEHIAATLRNGKQYNHSIDLVTVEGHKRDLVVDPYLLGYWLGDGTHTQAAVTVHPEDQDHLRVQVEKSGYQMSVRKAGTHQPLRLDERSYSVGITGGFLDDLRMAGVLGDKHIPGEYLRASREQRTALLQGLIDSDGHIDKLGHGEFSNTNKELLLGFVELASSLGMRVGKPKRNRVAFHPCGVQAARLPRKAERLKPFRPGADERRSIVAVTPVETRPVRCITVDSEDQTFVVTEHMVKTHNCYLIARDRLDIDTPDVGPIWEIVAVTEIQRIGESWRVRHENGNWIDLATGDPVIRLWNPDPENRMEAWSPFRSLMPTLREIEWLTKHIFTQVRSRLMSAGVWFLPNNLTFPPPPPEAIEGDYDAAMAAMNESEQFMVSLASSGMETLDGDEVSFPSIVMADPIALAQIDQNKLIQFWSTIDDAAMVLRSDAVRRFSLGMDLPPEQVLGSSGLAVTGAGGSAGCVDDQTEALTKRGWVKGDDLHPGDEVLTLNHETGVSEWQTVRVMNRFEVVDEPMLRMQGVGHDSVTTMNHRWAVIDREGRRKFVTSEALNQAHRIPTAAPHADFPVEAKYSDAFVELVAWWWTEGCHSGGTEDTSDTPYVDSLGRVYPSHKAHTGSFGQASIAQSHTRNPERVESIRRALETEFPQGWGAEHQRRTQTGYGEPVTAFHLRREAFDALNAVAPGKVVSLDFIHSLTRAQIELFIQTSCAGDGWHYRRGDLDIWQRDHSVLEAYELALILSGRMVAESEHAGGKVVNAYRKSTVRPFHAAASPGARMEIEEVEYTGTVWCPTVENSTWLARRGGTVWFTGNSVNHWGVWANEEQTISAHIEPALDDLVAVLTSAFLYNAVEGTDKVIGYDTATLRLRQDRSKEAIELYDRGLLNRAVTLREVGFDPEHDMMDDNEFKRWLLVKLAGGSATPEQVQAAFSMLGVALPVQPPAVSRNSQRDGDGDGEIGEAREKKAIAPSQPGRNQPRNLDDHPVQGPPREQHDHSPAPFGLSASAGTADWSPLHASAEVLVLRALEKAGNRLLNNGKRGRDRDRETPAHLAHCVMSAEAAADDAQFDFSLAPTVFGDLSAMQRARVEVRLGNFCTDLYANGTAYTRKGLTTALRGL